jgi:hypothetical protein
MAQLSTSYILIPQFSVTIQALDNRKKLAETIARTPPSALIQGVQGAV